MWLTSELWTTWSTARQGAAPELGRTVDKICKNPLSVHTCWQTELLLCGHHRDAGNRSQYDTNTNSVWDDFGPYVFQTAELRQCFLSKHR